MLPRFPDFAPVTLAAKNIIESYTHQYDPYSDFNFFSLWCWDTNHARAFSVLNENLIILITDYATEAPVYSILGQRDIDDTVHHLIAYLEATNQDTTLRYVPGCAAARLNPDTFICTPDRGDFDYIFSLTDLRDLPGRKYKSKRHLLKRFRARYPAARFLQFEQIESTVADSIFSVIERWRQNKEQQQKDYDLDHEFAAIKTLLTNDQPDTLTVSLVLHDETPIAFSIDERLPKQYILSHFSKADHCFSGVYDFMNAEIAKRFLTQGYRWWNWEQDLNEAGLREAKLRYRPVSFLEKYRVTLR
jgi:hypothetical protein